MKRLTNLLKRLWQDESAQGVSEYILLLVVVIAVATLFKTQIKNFLEAKLTDIGGKMSGFTGD